MRVEKVDENILDSELGWVCSKEDAKVLLERAGLTNEAKKKANAWAKAHANAWAKAHHALERRVAATSESRRRLTVTAEEQGGGCATADTRSLSAHKFVERRE